MTRPLARRRRRRLVAVLLAASLSAGAALLVAQERRAQAQAAAARQTAQARATAEAERARADAGRQATLARALSRLAPPAGRVADLLVALAKTTPRAVTLRSFSSSGDHFVLRGHAYETGAAATALLLRYRRDLAPPAAAWVLGPAEPAGGGAGDFAWEGQFLLPEPPALARAEGAARLAALRAALFTATALDAWMAGWARAWTPTARADEIWPDLVLRHYAFAYADLRLGAWSDLVEAIAAAAGKPGLTIDSVSLSAPQDATAFTQAQVTLTARARP